MAAGPVIVCDLEAYPSSKTEIEPLAVVMEYRCIQMNPASRILAGPLIQGANFVHRQCTCL